MARNDEAVKIDDVWAESVAGNRQAITPALRSDGWGVSFSLAGGGELMRLNWNQIFCELSAVAWETNRFGIMEWNATLDYDVNAVVRVGANAYQALQSSGPGSDRDASATNPTTANTPVWEQLFARTADL